MKRLSLMCLTVLVTLTVAGISPAEAIYVPERIGPTGACVGIVEDGVNEVLNGERTIDDLIDEVANCEDDAGPVNWN